MYANQFIAYSKNPDVRNLVVEIYRFNFQNMIYLAK